MIYKDYWLECSLFIIFQGGLCYLLRNFVCEPFTEHCFVMCVD